MSVHVKPPELVLADVLAAHTQICGVPLQGQAAGTQAGETVYAVRCPKCSQVVAHLIVEDGAVRR